MTQVADAMDALYGAVLGLSCAQVMVCSTLQTVAAGNDSTHCAYLPLPGRLRDLQQIRGASVEKTQMMEEVI